MADIFISYKREDYPLAKSVAEKLIACGWTVWWDRNIPVGKAYDKVIEEEMAAAKCIITLWTKDSVNSMNVKEEAQEGLRRNILIPISVGDVSPPYGFKMIQTLAWNTTTPDDDLLDELVAQIPRLVEPGEWKEDEEEQDDNDNNQRGRVSPEPMDNPGKDTATGTLQFTRVSRLAAMFIAMTIYIDDVMVGKVANDETTKFPLPAGPHSLQVKGGMAFSTGKEQIQVKPGETQQWNAEFTMWNTIKLKRVS